MPLSQAQISPEQILRGSLRPGNQVDIIVARDDDGEFMEVRASRLHDISSDGKLILAQTTPALGRSHVGRDLEVTFLFFFRGKDGSRWVRSAFPTPLLEVISSYRLGPNLEEPVLVVAAPVQLSEGNLRLHYRLYAPLGVNVNIVPKEKKKLLERRVDDFNQLVRQELLASGANATDALRVLTEALNVLVERLKNTRIPSSGSVLDISLGGLAFSYPQNWEFPTGNPLELTLSWGDTTMEIKAQVVRGGKVAGGGLRRPSFTSAQFVDLDSETRMALREFFTVLVRKELARRSGLEQ